MRFGHDEHGLLHQEAAVQRVDHDYDRLGYSFWLATLRGTPGEHLFYRVFNGADGTLVFRVRVPRAESADAVVAVVGDIGLSYSAPMVVQALKQDPGLDLWVHPGDVSYAFQIEEMNRYLDRLQSVVARMPYMACLGNHEAENAGVLRAFNTRFPTDVLGAASGSHSPEWYSYDAYGIHFLVLNSQADVNAGSAQHAFARADLYLAAERRRSAPAKFPWLFVVLHYPLWSSHNRKNEPTKPQQMKCLRDGLEDLFHEFGVDVVIAGRPKALLLHGCAWAGARLSR